MIFEVAHAGSNAASAEAGIDTEVRVDPPGKDRLPIGGRLTKSSAGRARILERLYTGLKRRNNFGGFKKAARKVVEVRKVRNCYATFFSSRPPALVKAAAPATDAAAETGPPGRSPSQ